MLTFLNCIKLGFWEVGSIDKILSRYCIVKEHTILYCFLKVSKMPILTDCLLFVEDYLTIKVSSSLVLGQEIYFTSLITYLMFILDDQRQVDSKPAGQPEHASLNQCQLIAANRGSGIPSWWWRFLCNVIYARALIGLCSHVTSRCCLIWYSWHESSM